MPGYGHRLFLDVPYWSARTNSIKCPLTLPLFLFRGQMHTPLCSVLQTLLGAGLDHPLLVGSLRGSDLIPPLLSLQHVEVCSNAEPAAAATSHAATAAAAAAAADAAAAATAVPLLQAGLHGRPRLLRLRIARPLHAGCGVGAPALDACELGIGLWFKGYRVYYL